MMRLVEKCVNKLRATLAVSLLLLLACDVELNPGPDTRGPDSTLNTAFPCAICEEALLWNSAMLCCDNCDDWYHKDCLEMNTTLFEHCQSKDSAWICTSCNQPNFSTLPMNSPTVNSADNTYSSAATSMRRINSLASSASFHDGLSSCDDGINGSCASSNSQLQPQEASPGIPLAFSSPQSDKPCNH